MWSGPVRRADCSRNRPLPGLLRIFSISRSRRSALIDAAARLAAAKVLLSTIGMRRTTRLLRRDPRRLADRDLAMQMRETVLRAAEALPFATNCLDRAVALWWSLTSRGSPAELRLGVRFDATRNLRAHAWVEVDGDALLDEIAGSHEALEATNHSSGRS
jgi:hypothetical protein